MLYLPGHLTRLETVHLTSPNLPRCPVHLGRFFGMLVL